MNRRKFLALAASKPLIGVSGVAEATGLEAFLSETRYINSGDPRIRKIVNDHAPAHLPDKARALALFTYVRDEIPFGFADGFWDQTAVEVLDAGVGYCNTKSTLFTTLLRASGIPARQVFVDIDVAVLHGLIDPGTPYLDHSYVEVFLDGAWVATDAFIVDQALFTTARTRVILEGRRFGYGIHIAGTMDWDGTGPSYAQYNQTADARLGTRVWGVYPDIGAFYAQAEKPWNRLNLLLRAGFGVLAGSANAKADLLRRR